MKLPLKLANEFDPLTKSQRWIIRDADGRKLGDYGSRVTATHQLLKHTKMIQIAS